MMQTDTIVAIATALSESGIGIIRISGEEAVSIADKIFVNAKGKRILCHAKSHTLHYGFILDGMKEDWKEGIVDEVVVSVFLAPKSYTKEDTVEINCHGGILLLQKVLQLACRAGARLAEPGEFTKRAFLNGRMDLSKAEAVMDLIHAQNELAMKNSVKQLRGNLEKRIRNLREKIIYEIAFIESALDDPEHISLDGYQERLLEEVSSLKKEMAALLDTAKQGRLLKEGVRTVILGKPNAGKSSLMNLLLGEERAIVTEIAGTTRDVLQESVRIKNISLEIIDTAGIRRATDKVEQIGVARAWEYAKDADLVLYVVDASVALDENDAEIIGRLKDKKVIVLLNKNDLMTQVSEDEIKAAFEGDDNCVRMIKTSTKSEEENSGLEALYDCIEEMFSLGEISQNQEIVITSLRHQEALQEAYESCCMVENSLQLQLPEDFYSIDLMNAYICLGRIIGEAVEDDLVQEIFSKFCMGK